MTQWTALSRNAHANARYLPREGYSFAAGQRVTPILLAELGRLLPHHVLGFIREGERYQPVALLSLAGDASLYVAPNGKWLGHYIPAAMRGYPFRLATNDEGQQALCIEESHLSQDGQGKPLFDDEGNLAQHVTQVMDFLATCERNRQVTETCMNKLVEADVIEPWALELSRGEDKEPLKVEGFYRISEKRLNSLDAETLHALRGGPLSLAYAQLFSTHQLSELTKRAALLADAAKSQEVPENLDSLFDSGEDDDLTFDFDS